MSIDTIKLHVFIHSSADTGKPHSVDVFDVDGKFNMQWFSEVFEDGNDAELAQQFFEHTGEIDDVWWFEVKPAYEDASGTREYYVEVIGLAEQVTDEKERECREALLPCPHCGGAQLNGPEKVEYVGDNYWPHWWIECEDCPCGMEADGETSDAVIAAWNRRAPTADGVEVRGLRAALRMVRRAIGLPSESEDGQDLLDKLDEIRQAPAEQADFIMMPKALTADNGAKAALSGEFFEAVEHGCTDCLGEDDDCEICSGTGVYTESVAISWTNIKAIYKKAVELLGNPALLAEQNKDELLHAFVQGAKWWEYHKTQFTMWQSDQNLAWKAAEGKLAKGTLGQPLPAPPKEER